MGCIFTFWTMYIMQETTIKNTSNNGLSPDQETYCDWLISNPDDTVRTPLLELGWCMWPGFTTKAPHPFIIIGSLLFLINLLIKSNIFFPGKCSRNQFWIAGRIDMCDWTLNSRSSMMAFISPLSFRKHFLLFSRSVFYLVPSFTGHSLSFFSAP